LVEAALSDVAATAVSPSAAVAGNGPATPIKSVAAKIKAALALIVMWKLPLATARRRNETPPVSTARQKKGIFKLQPAKAGQCRCRRARVPQRGCQPAQSML
jgi:hypothetical protein